MSSPIRDREGVQVEHGPTTCRHACIESGAPIEIWETSLAVPIAAALEGVAPGAALPALHGGFRGALEPPSAGPGGGVQVGLRLRRAAALRATGRDRLLEEGRRRASSGEDVGARRESEPDASVTTPSWKVSAPQLFRVASRLEATFYRQKLPESSGDTKPKASRQKPGRVCGSRFERVDY